MRKSQQFTLPFITDRSRVTSLNTSTITRSKASIQSKNIKLPTEIEEKPLDELVEIAE